MGKGKQLGRYKVLRRLSSGGMGEVFVAQQGGMAGFKKLVVLKTLRPDLAERQSFRDMFFEEARVSALARHANVVSVLDVGIDKGTHYIVMEYIEGWSVRQVLEACNTADIRLPLPHVILIAIDVANGLDHIHGLRDSADRPLTLVHRDVSPENVMITVDGLSKLVDFGIAKRRGSPIVTEPGVLKGKARYLAPEQVRGGTISPATDQFALASVMFEMCTGEPLFTGKTTVEVMFALGRGVIRDAQELRPDLPDSLAGLLRRALAREPDDRYPTCGAIVDELVAIQTTEGMRETRAALIAFLEQRLRRPVADRAGDDTQPETAGMVHDTAAFDSTAILRGPSAPEIRDPAEETQVSRLIGRAEELARTASLFNTGTRLVTLLGPGGVGKTSLASHYVYTQRRDAAEQEIYFCDLSEARSRADVAYLVAETLSVPLTGDVSWQQAVDHVGEALGQRRAILIILDNVEQVIDGVADSVARWLQAASGVRFLATSREALNVSDERRVDISPLPRDEAIDLLCHRIQAIRPGWTPGESDRQVAGHIVDRLDRLPLAIELAAARGGVLSMTQLHGRLTSGLDWLRSRRRDLSMRHTSLSETIAWSWGLLGRWEREALAQCSMFRGGFTLVAAEKVIVLPDEADRDVIDAVQSLREKSLLYTDAARSAVEDELRFRMYESIRDFAAAKLDPEQRAAASDRHLAYYLAEAEELASGVDGPEGARCLDRIAAGLDNFTAALDHAKVTDPARATRLVLAVERLLAARGPAHLHRDWLVAGLEAARAVGSVADVSRLLKARGMALMPRGESTSAWADLCEAIELGENVGDSVLVAEACEAMAAHHLQRRELGDVKRYQERAHDIYRQLSHREGEARILGQIGLYHQRSGDFDRASNFFDQAIALHERRGNLWAAGQLYGRRGLLFFETRRLADARRDLERSIATARTWGDVIREATDYLNLGCVELEPGNLDQARACFERARSLYARAGHRSSQAIVHVNLAVADLDQRRLDSAEKHLAQAQAIARETQYHSWQVMAVGNLGILAQSRGDLATAREHLERVRDVEADYPVSWAALSTFLAHLASVQASLSDLAGARKTFAMCRARIERGNHLHSLALVECLEGFCDLAEARRQEAPDEAHRLIEIARGRASVDADESCDLRIARRLLDRAIAEVEPDIAE